MAAYYSTDANGLTILEQDGPDYNNAAGYPGIINPNNTASSGLSIAFHGTVTVIPPATASGTNPTTITPPYVPHPAPPFFSLNVAVGSKISFLCESDVYVGNGSPNAFTSIIELDLSVSGGYAILSDQNYTKYTVAVGKYGKVSSKVLTGFPEPPNASTFTDFPGSDPGSANYHFYSAASFSFFIDNTVGAQTWTVTAKYASGNYTAYFFNINVQKPNVTLNPLFPAHPNFGPYIYRQWTNNVPKEVDQFLSSWVDPAYLVSNNQSGYPANYNQYRFGCGYQSNVDNDTQNAMRFSAVVQNTTATQGVFYLLQIARPNIGGSGTSIYDYPIKDAYAGYSFPTVDLNNNPRWAIDGTQYNDFNDPVPYAYQNTKGNITPVQSANSATQFSIPVSAEDINGVQQTYIADNPSFAVDPNATSETRTRYLFNLALNDQFITYIVFQQTNNTGDTIGIPIGVAAVVWIQSCNETNNAIKQIYRSDLDADINQYWLTTYTVPANWTSQFQPSLYVSVINYAPSLIYWNDTVSGIYADSARLKRLSYMDPQVPLHGTANSGPMGLVARISGQTAHGLYNGLSANIGVLNTVL